MPTQAELEKDKERIEKIYRNRDALIAFQRSAWKQVQDDMLMLITRKRPKPGEAHDGRKHQLIKARTQLFKGLLKMFRLRADGKPSYYAHRYNPHDGFRKTSWEELITVTNLTWAQVRAGLREFDQAGIITRRRETIHGGDGIVTKILFLRLNGGKLCSIFHQICDEKRLGEHTDVDIRITFSGTSFELPGRSSVLSVCAAPAPALAAAPSAVISDSAVIEKKKKASAAQDVECLAAAREAAQARRAVAFAETSVQVLETQNFKDAITRLYKTAFPDQPIKPSTRSQFLRYHQFRDGHQQFNLETVTRWLDGWSQEVTCPFPVWFKIPEELARWWVHVADEMHRYSLQPLALPTPVDLLPDKEQAAAKLDMFATYALYSITKTHEELSDVPERILDMLLMPHDRGSTVGRFYLAHTTNSPYMQQLIELHGEALHQALLLNPDYYCLLQAVGINAKDWTVRPDQFEKDITASLNSMMHDQASRTGLTQVWELDKD